MNRQHTHEKFVEKLNKIKPSIRCKDGEEYKGSFYKLTFICDKGHEFQASPSNILNRKYLGCKACSIVSLSKQRRKDPEKFIQEMSIVHPSYEVIGEYMTCFDQVEIRCANGHIFSSRASDLISGAGCSICKCSGYKDNLPGTLYYLKVQDGDDVYYKIGITNLNVRKRFNLKDRAKITVLMEEYYENGLLARTAEKQVLACFKEFLAKDVNILKKGNTELFTKDVLCLDC